MRVALGILCYCSIMMGMESTHAWHNGPESLLYTQGLCKLRAATPLSVKKIDPPSVIKTLPFRIVRCDPVGTDYFSAIEDILKGRVKINGEDCPYIDLVSTDASNLPSKRYPSGVSKPNQKEEQERLTKKQAEFMKRLKKGLTVRATLFVALYDDQLVGFATHQPTAESCARPSFWTTVTHSVGVLATHQDYLRYGIGKQLLQQVATYAQDNRATHLVISTNADNAIARNAYAKFTGAPVVATCIYPIPGSTLSLKGLTSTSSTQTIPHGCYGRVFYRKKLVAPTTSAHTVLLHLTLFSMLLLTCKTAGNIMNLHIQTTY